MLQNEQLGRLQPVGLGGLPYLYKKCNIGGGRRGVTLKLSTEPTGCVFVLPDRVTVEERKEEKGGRKRKEDM